MFAGASGPAGHSRAPRARCREPRSARFAVPDSLDPPRQPLRLDLGLALVLRPRDQGAERALVSAVEAAKTVGVVAEGQVERGFAGRRVSLLAVHRSSLVPARWC